MKSLLITLLSTICISHAATTITAANFSLSTASPGQYGTQIVTDSVAKTPYVGSYMIGTFNTTTGLDAVGSISLSSFGWTQFGSNANFESLASRRGLFGTNGVTGTLPTTDNTGLVGKTIFVVIANATNSDYIIWNSGRNFAKELEGVGGAAVSFTTRDAGVSLLRGIVVENGNNGLTGASAGLNGQNAVTFGMIPEASTSLLGAIGALALLRRRRN